MERVHRAGGAEERGAFRAGGAGPGEHGGTGPEPFGRIAAAVEDPGAVEEEAEAGQRLGGAQVRGAEEREQRGPVEFTRGGEGGADVADQRDGGEGAGRRGGERHAEACEGFRESVQDPSRGDDGDVGRGEALVEEGSGEAGRGVALRVVGRGGKADHPPPGDGAGRREPDLEVALDRELVERLDPAQPGFRGGGTGRLLGEEGDAGQDPPGPRGQRRAEVEGGAGGGEEPLQDEEAEVAGLLREGAALGGDCGGTEGAGGVEGVAMREQVLVGGERRGGGEEPLADASGSGGGGGAEVGRGDLGGAKLGEEARGGPSGAARSRAAPRAEVWPAPSRRPESRAAARARKRSARGVRMVRRSAAAARRPGARCGSVETRGPKRRPSCASQRRRSTLDFRSAVGTTTRSDTGMGGYVVGLTPRRGARSAEGAPGRTVRAADHREDGAWGLTRILRDFTLRRTRCAWKALWRPHFARAATRGAPGEVRDLRGRSRAPGHPRAFGEAEISRETVDP